MDGVECKSTPGESRSQVIGGEREGWVPRAAAITSLRHGFASSSSLTLLRAPVESLECAVDGFFLGPFLLLSLAQFFYQNLSPSSSVPWALSLVRYP